jgi:hypothetical protein
MMLWVYWLVVLMVVEVVVPGGSARWPKPRGGGR